MFIVAQFPLADLRVLVPGQMGRVPVPDSQANSSNQAFIRGFGKVSSRNSPGYGLAGEHLVADFDNAVKFTGPIECRQNGWPKSVPVQPRFRRFYFDGEISGRFEFGFVVEDTHEASLFSDTDKSYDPSQIAQAVYELPLVVCSLDGSKQPVLLKDCAQALALAYVRATTRENAVKQFPVAETCASLVAIGSPTIHLRISADRPVTTARDRRPVLSERGRELFITSADAVNVRNSVIVQISPAPTLSETAEERVTRVLFSHLNSLIFAHARFLAIHQADSLQSKKDWLKQHTARTLNRLAQVEPAAQRSATDDQFLGAVRAFAAAYTGRIDQLVEKLEQLAEDLNNPSIVDRLVGYAKSVHDLVITTAVKTAVERALKGGGP